LQLGIDEKRAFGLVSGFLEAHQGVQRFMRAARDHARREISHSIQLNQYMMVLGLKHIDILVVCLNVCMYVLS
jgi:hypothetical protein